MKQHVASEIFIILGLSDCSASILERTGGPDFLSSPTDGNCAVCRPTPALYMGDTVANWKAVYCPTTI